MPGQDQGSFTKSKFSSVLTIVDVLRNQSTESAGGSERYVGALLSVRSSHAYWLERSDEEADRAETEDTASPEDDNPS
jgi:hypothetical protein